jgi:hypothetical protein
MSDARLTPLERRLARSVHVHPAVDGHYYDAVNAAIADRDELLAAAREVIEAWPYWGDRGEAVERLREVVCPEPHPELANQT